jgi:hypothetical protein
MTVVLDVTCVIGGEVLVPQKETSSRVDVEPVFQVYELIWFASPD